MNEASQGQGDGDQTDGAGSERAARGEHPAPRPRWLSRAKTQEQSFFLGFNFYFFLTFSSQPANLGGDNFFFVVGLFFLFFFFCFVFNIWNFLHPLQSKKKRKKSLNDTKPKDPTFVLASMAER